MRVLPGLRWMLTLFVAVLMPLELGHCAFMQWQAPPVAIASEHPDGGDGCCSESAPTPTDPTDACCCDHVQILAGTPPAPVSVEAPPASALIFAVVPMAATMVHAQDAFFRLEPDARSGSPPDPSAAPQSPRGPPHSA